MPPNADAHTSDSAPNPSPTKRLGKYRIEKRIGAGGMGSVFLAVDTELRRTVALKVLPRERAANPQLVRRFKSEGTAAARLEHENIVRVFDAGEADGYLYIALEYIDGIDVQQLVAKRDRLPVRRSIEIVLQAAAALQHAYERGIVHRDIKPSNLLIRKDGVVKLADMGLARAIDETTEASITHAGMTVGTVDYISPEQGADSKRADIRSDLYSLGCSWYHMLTGEVPYPDGTAADRLRAHNLAPVPDPRSHNERIPRAVVAVLQRLMAKRPDDRYQTPQELIDDLRQPALLQRETGAADIAGLAFADSDEPASADPTRAVFSAGEPTAGEPTLREIVEEESDHDVSQLPPGKGPRKRKRTSSSKRGSGGAAARKSRTGKENRSSNEPTQRSERPEKFAVDQSAIDPDQLKLAGIGLLGLIVVAAVGWGVWQYVQTFKGNLSPAGGNPFARTEVEQSAPAPPPVVNSPAPVSERPSRPPPPQISAFQQESPFPGVADATNDSSITDVPRWVYEARERVLPQAQVATVDPDAPAGPNTAEEALRGLPSAGGVIEFRGRGPHRIESLEITGGKDIVFRAAEGQAPVLLWDRAEPDPRAKLSVLGGRLELNGLHIVASIRDRDDSPRLIGAENATVIIRDCSITVADPGGETVPVVQMVRSPAGPSRCVLENVYVRGSNATVATLDGPGQQFVAGNCVFATGGAPVVLLRDPAVSSMDAAQADASVQLLATVAVSRDAIFRCERRNGSATPSVLLRTRHSVFVGDGVSSTAVRITNWPEAPSGALDRPRVLGFRIVAEHTQWLNWTQLTSFQGAAGDDPVLVGSDAQWLQFWRAPLAGVSDGGPHAAEPIGDYRAASAEAILTRAGISQSENAPAVAALKVADLPSVPENQVARLVAIVGRPRVPADLDAAFSSAPVTIDLKKRGLKLNDALNELPDGTHVVLRANKGAVIQPVSLTGKSLRIEFDGGGNPLVVSPLARSGGDRAEALFRVEQGRLDLINANLRIPKSDRTPYPLRLLDVVNGSFVVRNCILRGQFGNGSQGTPTVEWRPAEDDATQFGLIEDSLIVGQAQAVSATLAGQVFGIRNSIVVSDAEGVVLFAAPTNQRSTFSVSSCTLSAGQSCVRIAASADQAGAGGPLQVFVDQTVYGPPVVPSKAPALLVERSPENQPLHVDWWEQHTAISDRITRFRVTDDSETAAQQIGDAWLRGWGPEHVNDVAYDPLSVVLSTKDIQSSKTTPQDWALDAKSLAATASPDGGPVGADPEMVGPDSTRSGGARKVETSPKRGPTRRRRPTGF